MAKNSVRLHLAFHHHQPHGNLPDVLDECCRRGYLPLLEAMERAEGLKFNLSYSAPLLEHFEARLPGYLDRLRALVEAGRVEILAAAHHEPILADLEEEERLEHIAESVEWWRSRLGIRPRGLWLAEWVWDNDLPRTLRRAGLEYTLAAKERFLQAGVAAARIQGSFTTDWQGETCRVFPADEQFQKVMPFGTPEDAQNLIRRLANRADQAFTFADNAERWGVWPGTGERVIESGYLDRLFAALLALRPQLEVATLSSSLERPATGPCYLPPGVSQELGFWSLPDESRTAFQQARENLRVRFDADQFLPYFRVGSWAGFRARYREANLMHKKALWLRRSAPAGHPQAARIRRLVREAQCNTAYWYGTAGGIYAPHLREAVWARLLEAQRLLLGAARPPVQRADLDADGADEVLYQHPAQCALLAPARGGALLEWSDLERGINVLNTMTRHRESVAGRADRSIGTVENTAPPPVDAYDRHAFQDLVFRKPPTTEELASGSAGEIGGLPQRLYALVACEETPDGLRAVLEAETVLPLAAPMVLRLRKVFTWSDAAPRAVHVEWTWTNAGTLPLRAVAATAANLALPGADGELHLECAGHRHGPLVSWFEGGASGWALASASCGLRIEASWEGPAHVWAHPLLTPRGEGGSIRQGHCLVMGWPLDLAPGASFACAATLRIVPAA